jgi:ABC-2 type transport system permease protein
MRQLWTIIGRETDAFFKSAMAPVVLTGFLVAAGALFFNLMSNYSQTSLSLLQNPQGNSFMNLSEGLFGPMSRQVAFFLMFMLPAITMRVFAPEFGSGRYDLIASWPVENHIWVLGKWLSTWLVAIVLAVTGAAYYTVVWFWGSPEIGPVAIGLAGQIMLLGCLAAWGVMASSLFKHQILAYFSVLSWFIFLLIVGALEPFLPGLQGDIARELSPLNHFDRFSRGIVDTRDILYFILMTLVPLFATIGRLSSRRMPGKRKIVLWTPTLLVIALAIVVYVLGQTWVVTSDLTGNKRYSLAPQTLQVLDSLPDNLAELRAGAESQGGVAGDLSKVKVLAFYVNSDPARGSVEALFKSCALRSNRFEYEFIDPNVELELVRRYQVKASQTVVVQVGDRYTTLMQPGESALASALYRLSTGKMARICHLLGHGEHLTNSDDRSGYAGYEYTLREQGYDVRPFHMSEIGKVPDSCDVLVIAGPKLQPEPYELEEIENHLARGGSVLAMFDPPTPTAWVDWMAQWRVGLTGDVLIAVERAGAERGISARTIFIDEGYGDHEVVSSMRGLTTIFPLVQTLEQVGEPDSVTAGAIILQSSDQTWSESDPETRFFSKPREADLIEIRGKDPLSQPVVLSETGKKVLKWASLLGWPLFVGSLALGFMLMTRREKGGPA